MNTKRATSEGGDSAAIAAASKRPPQVLSIDRKDGESNADAVVRHAANPVTRAAITSRKLTSYLAEDADITTYAKVLREQTAEVAKGNISAIESMLVTQAMTLDAIFNHMSMRALEIEWRC